MGLLPFLILGIFTILAFVFYANSIDSFFWDITRILSTCAFILMMILWPFIYCGSLAFVEGYKARQSVLQYYLGKSDNERTAAILKVMDMQKELAIYKYWNGTIFDYFISDEINDCKR